MYAYGRNFEIQTTASMDISFADRLRNIVVLSSALAQAGQDAEESRTQARSLEEEILKSASTKDDYQDRYTKLLATLQPTTTLDHPPVTADEDEILNPDGPSLGDYHLATFHQDGQMSTIFKAKAKDETAAVHIVALKVTHPSVMAAPHNSEREGRILAACQHENVVPLLQSFWESGDRFVLVFPFLRQDLENLLRTGTLNGRQCSLVFSGLFNALSHIHSLGIIHRDIKPSNILLKTMDGPVYLADFGIAWSPTDQDSEPAAAKITDVGTTCYRPPELLFGHRAYDTSLDMWAAGCVVGEMVKDGHYPMFDAGPLGSELGLIKSIFTTLGTPNEKTWPSAEHYPDWGKMRFQVFPPKGWKDILPGASDAAIDFVSKTVSFESTLRLTARQALEHPLRADLARA